MRRPSALLWVLAVALGAGGCGGGTGVPAAATLPRATTAPSASGASGGADSSPSSSPSRNRAATGTAGSAGDGAAAAGSFRSPRTYQAVAEPVRLRIPAIGVDAPLVHLGLARDGTIDAPRGWQQAGWYAGGPRPGQPGPAILLGHVDSTSGPALFYRVASLRQGAAVVVDRADGTSVTFVVSGRLQVAKSRFPADLVYGPTLSPTLRLVTCGGTFNSKTGHYRDNVVVTAVPRGSS